MEKFNFKKKFGQNFLKDVRVVERIVSVANITKEDLVIEVGPGKGILTKELARRAKKVLCYEIDLELKEYLLSLQETHQNIDIIFEDFIKRDINLDIKKYEYKKVYFVSNVPYYITTPILMKIMNSHINFSRIVMMVQKEVGDRFSAKPRTKEYGSLTVYLNYFYQVKKEFLVNRKEFIPVPNVDSVVVSFTKKEELLKVNDLEFFFQLVRDSFQFKRKNIKNNLSKYDLQQIEEVLEKSNYHLTSRAEELPVEVFVEISNALTK